jgi:hypothetical protein
MGLTHHDGISLYGSGVYIGRKAFETPMFVGKGFGAQSGTVQVTYGLPRFDVGSVGTSGHSTSVSTRLSSIAFAVATAFDVACTSGIAPRLSWSGHCVDILNLTVTGSANASSTIAFCAWGV